MAKQLYIDENGNPIEVSGTINNASMLPISGNDSTNTKTYIDTGLSGLIKTATVTGTTTASGALTIPNTIDPSHILNAIWNDTGIQKYAFVRSDIDPYFQVMYNDGNTLVPFANQSASFLVMYY